MIKHLRNVLLFFNKLSLLIVCLVMGVVTSGFCRSSFMVISKRWIVPLETHAHEPPTVNNENELNSFDRSVIIKGTVFDEKKEPLIGVTVSAIDAQAGTQTDVNGKFSLTVPDGVTRLKFTYIGYETQIVPINGRKTLTIYLNPTENALQDVVVVGYGTQKKESVVGAISQIRGDDLKRVGGVSSISEALQGQLPGLAAVSTNGKPGSDAANLYIRGIASFNSGGSDPYVLVDGVERNLNQVDPNEVQSISVLKDASATAVYGTRGANGVILVTTKRGKRGKPTFSFTSNFGFKTPTVNQTYPDYVTTQQLYNEAAMNDKLYANVIPQSVISAWQQNLSNAGPYNQYFPQINWWDELVKKVGYQQNYNLNASGGSDYMRYFVSVGLLDDGDIYKTKANDQFDPSFSLKRYNWRSNFDFDITKTTVFSINFSGNFRYRNQPGYRIDGGGEDGFGQDQFFQRLLSAPRNSFPLQYADGKIGESSLGENNMLVALNDGGQRIYKYYQGFYDAQLVQKLDFVTKGLGVKGKVSYTSSSNYETNILANGVTGNATNINTIRYYRQYDLSNPQVGAGGVVTYPLLNQIRYPTDQTQPLPLSSTGDNIYGYERDLYYELSLNYDRTFGKHAVTALLLANRRANVDQGNITTTAKPIKIGEYGEDYVGRLTYNFQTRYLFELDGAYTGSSRFPKGKQFGFFPSAAVGWVVSEEPYFKKLVSSNIVSYLKLRYNWGRVGSDRGLGTQQFVASYSGSANIKLGNQNSNSFGPLYYEGASVNENTTWEKSTKQDFGVEFEILKKLKGTVDLFKEDREDILMQLLSVPRAFGNTPPTANIGKTKNHGYEIELNWNDQIGKFRYYVRPSYSWSENRVLFRDDPRLSPEYLKNAGKQINTQTRLIQDGYYNSLDDIYNYARPNVGTAQGQIIPGDFIYSDYNADGIIDQFDFVPMAYTKVPLKTYGLNLGFTFKSWSFNVLFYGASNVYKEIPDLFLWDFGSGFLNGQPNIAQRWTPATAAMAEKPSLHLSNVKHNQGNGSTYTYVDASYVRLKNAEISYDVQSKFIKRAGIKSLQLYVNGNNLLTFTGLDRRLDPETSGANVYPVVRRYNIGLRTNF